MIRSITTEQLLAKVNSYTVGDFSIPGPQKLLLVEVGDFRSYEIVHIRGAVFFRSVTSQSMGRHQQIVVYGSSAFAEEPRLFLSQIEREFSRDLFYYLAGKAEWFRSGLWTKSSLVPADHLDGVSIAASGLFRAA